MTVNIPFGRVAGGGVYDIEKTDTDSSEELLARAIAAIGTADFVPATLGYLRSAAYFTGCLLTILNGGKRPVHVYDNVRAERRAVVVDRYLDGAYLLDPFYSAYRLGTECAVLRLRDVAPDRFQQSTYYRSYYGELNLGEELGIFIDLPDGRYLFYSIGRPREMPRFSARDLTALRRSLPIVAALNRRHFTDRVEPAPDEGVHSEDIDATFDRFGAESLTVREREIAALILKGHSSKSIARNIDISPGTVKIHRKNIYRKLNISSQSELFGLFLTALTGPDPA